MSDEDLKALFQMLAEQGLSLTITSSGNWALMDGSLSAAKGDDANTLGIELDLWLSENEDE